MCIAVKKVFLEGFFFVPHPTPHPRSGNLTDRAHCDSSSQLRSLHFEDVKPVLRAERVR